mmetsp:Transcript_39268/g.73260  ORF Transcript_39268/g.73260 Transcript_39268/m.73260 type:complete len:336 (+) Transcript_39268:74-1081(+)
MVALQQPEAPPKLTSEQVCSGLEIESVTVCGLSFRILRRRTDFFAAVAGDLPLSSTGVVLWESALLLAEYLGFGGFLSSALGSHEAAERQSAKKWWQTHPPAAVVPSRFWSEQLPVLELGGGAGLVAAALTSLGAAVVYTDGDLAAIETAKLNCRNAQSLHARKRKRHPDAKDAKDAKGVKPRGSCVFRHLPFGDADAARRLADDLGPFGHVVGSDLLYGETAPPGPLLDTLAAVAESQHCQDRPSTEPFLVTLAIKNRCCDEAEAFAAAARERRMWTVDIADPSLLPESFQRAAEGFCGCQEKAAYCIVHLRLCEDYLRQRSPQRAARAEESRG